MPIGTKMTVIISRSEDGQLDNVEKILSDKFTHSFGFTTTYTVTKDDISNTNSDKYIVVTNWAQGDAGMPVFTGLVVSSPPPAITAASIVSDAITKVNAVFPGTFV